MKTTFFTSALTLIMLCFTHSASANVAPSDITYTGKLGKINITFSISAPDASGSVFGRYFYDSQCLDIPFEGTKKSGVFTLYAGSFFRENNEKELFNLTAKGNTLKGTWSYKGKKLAVLLTKTSYDSKKDPYASNSLLKEKMATDAYERIRISKAVLTALDSSQQLNTGVTIQWYKEKHWNSYVFRVVKGLPDATMKWVNSYLEFQQLLDFSDRGTCSFGEPSDYESTISDIFINENFLAYNNFTYFYCGGAHPENSSSQHNLDLKGLKLLKTEDLIRFADAIPDESDFDGWSLYRSEVFSPTIMDMLTQEHPEEMKPVDMENEEGCDYTDATVWEFSNVLITEEGLWFSAYFYRAARMCDDPEWSVISYERLADYLNPDYKKALLSTGK